jgi:hypothetical protein
MSNFKWFEVGVRPLKHLGHLFRAAVFTRDGTSRTLNFVFPPVRKWALRAGGECLIPTTNPHRDTTGQSIEAPRKLQFDSYSRGVGGALLSKKLGPW